jgi:hypothetical protein
VDVFWCTTCGGLRVCCHRWGMGTHQGAVTRECLDYYLDEFPFRFKRESRKALVSPGAASRRHRPATLQVSDPPLAPRRFGCPGTARPPQLRKRPLTSENVWCGRLQNRCTLIIPICSSRRSTRLTPDSDIACFNALSRVRVGKPSRMAISV